MKYFSSKLITSLALLHACLITPASAEDAKETSYGKVEISYTELPNIGLEQGVMRRDPSDIIKVGDLYYVWYSKGTIAPGYDATVWYATSKDGLTWDEKGMALAKGKPGTWEGASVFTPNIMVADGRYWLFYTGTSNEFAKKPFNPDSKIGLAVSDSPDGPWERVGDGPVVTNSSNDEEFDSHLIDDACLIIRGGKYWLYYKGRQQGKGPGQTKMGVAIADKPEGPYVKHANNPIIPGNHEVVVWPLGEGVAAMIGTTGPKDITRSILYAKDGLNFVKTHNVIKGPVGAGAYRPEAFTDSNKGEHATWGVELQYPARGVKGLPYIQRWDAKWSD
ncbi:family 43 glycosylhydrolase [Verrucomicrobiaceae bacterium 5K15]|uniref:Family 43 glycosylhydrolase n=1 Tax=Oceaniferula flava TaxID=2800421 RepID=A0AAE2SDV8_9BACT|nr:family 43 glycosylhydrolase [Oceaniferula flavus]MBK1855607.1 family 43 glycosylhydrolase [Oceaniferula flavus]MBM1136913.1 family 43 glycosylhydrolase [Oceaniferula flavus]